MEFMEHLPRQYQRRADQETGRCHDFTGLDKVGYHFINIDDGFFGFRDEKGILHTHPQRFPNGMKGIADYIHSLGLKAGIYSEASQHMRFALGWR